MNAKLSVYQKQPGTTPELIANAMRIALETLAIEKAIPRLSPSDLIRAQSVLEIIGTRRY